MYGGCSANMAYLFSAGAVGASARTLSLPARQLTSSVLFSALEVGTGQVKTCHRNHRKRRDFIAFMNQLVPLYGDTELHVILDNLNIHKKNYRWQSRHKNVHFHYIQTNSPWLNQIEIWFSILSRRALKKRSFTSTGQVRDGIDRFVKVYNREAKPFKCKKKKVYQKPLKKSYADLCK